MHAVENGTRTVTGEPGPRYWQQRASYSIDARLDVEGRRLEGSAIVTYHNASPDTLPLILFKLYQNLHAVGAARHDPAEVTRGVALTRVAVNGNALRADRRQGAGYGVFGTRLGLWLEEPLAPGDSTVIEIDFAYDVPRVGAGGRMGWSDDNLFHLAYWYPQLAVFDDVVEWHADPFLGRAEFYAGFADYDVRIDVPEGWVVLGTGTLLNEEEVFPPLIRERIRRAEASDDVVQVLTADDFGPGRATVESPGGRLTWRLTADRVRDMAFSVTRESLWDAARTPVGDRDGDGSTDYARVDALYRAAATSWTNAARYAQHVIDFLSRDLGLPYPWPHMTVVEGDGIIGGGMEYPMVTLIGAYNGQPSQALYGVIAHELAHMWLPMTVNSDEVRWAWMDEGTTSFNTTQAATEFFPAFDHEAQEVQQYAGAAGAGFDGAMMRWTDWEYPDGWGIAAYAKPAAAMVALRYVLGDEVFDEAYSQAVGLLPHVRDRQRHGARLVLAWVVLRDLDDGPRHRACRIHARRDPNHCRGPGRSANAGDAHDHARGWIGGTARRSGGPVAGGYPPGCRAGPPWFPGGAGRARRSGSISGHGPRQRRVESGRHGRLSLRAPPLPAFRHAPPRAREERHDR
jgi:hypothetical protein